MNRLFVAIDLPEDLKDELVGIAFGVPGARWVDPDTLHLTLRFLGEVNGTVARDLGTRLDKLKIEPFTLRLADIGFFPPRGPAENLWVGVEKSEPLEHLRKSVDQNATRLGIEPDRRKWVPHVTLARLDEAPESRLARFAAEHSLYKSPPFEVGAITLYSSRLLTTGAVYQREAVFVLRG